VVVEFELLWWVLQSDRATLDGTEDNFTVPEAALSDVVSVFGYDHRVVEFLGAAVNLVNTFVKVTTVEFLQAIAAERE
jgi:hypothetical protein